MHLFAHSRDCTDLDGPFHFDADGLHKIGDDGSMHCYHDYSLRLPCSTWLDNVAVDNQVLLASFERSSLQRRDSGTAHAYRPGPRTATSSDHGYSTMRADDSDRGALLHCLPLDWTGAMCGVHALGTTIEPPARAHLPNTRPVQQQRPKSCTAQSLYVASSFTEKRPMRQQALRARFNGN